PAFSAWNAECWIIGGSDTGPRGSNTGLRNRTGLAALPDPLAALAAITKNSASTDKAEPPPRFYITGSDIDPGKWKRSATYP
ncbi:MAG: hypothetical protein WCD29_21675, partial [Pseudolabrys sp.]